MRPFDRSSLRSHKQQEKYFVPYEMDANFLFDAIKPLDCRGFNRRNRPEFTERAEDQIVKRQSLQITGKIMHQDNPRIKSNSKQYKNVKIVLQEPQNHIIEALIEQQDAMNIMSMQPTRNIEADHFTSQGASQSNSSIRLKYPSVDINEQEALERYEKMIVNNPVLYRKIMGVYNASKRHMDKQSKIAPKVYKKREVACEAKIKGVTSKDKNMPQYRKYMAHLVYREFLMAIQYSNRIIINPAGEVLYRAFVGKGNNGILVKSILKSRPWWSIRSFSDIDSCNLVWTQWKRTKFIKSLPAKKPLYLQIEDRTKVGKSSVKETNLNKLMSEGDSLFQRVDKSEQSDNYFNFTSNIQEQKHEQCLGKVFLDVNITAVNKEAKMSNHVPGCLQLHSKKLLFLNMSRHCERTQRDFCSMIPLTFLISKGAEDPQFKKFAAYFDELSRKSTKSQKKTNVWICKPGENSNRGNGICVLSSLNQIRSHVASRCGPNRTVVLQKYIENPYLYNKRKLDMRCYVLITTINGVLKAYWYTEGYIRTTSKEYNLKNLQNKLVHLTNDAIQKKGEQYGKFQSCNKVSFTDFEKYIELNPTEPKCTFGEVYTQIKQIATLLIKSVAAKLNMERREYSFELFGLDFMFDDRLRPYLIEANSNPCLQVDGNVLGRVIPTMLENAMRIAIDPVFPPPYSQNYKTSRFSIGNPFEQNKFELIYDSLITQEQVQKCQEDREEEEEEADVEDQE